MRNQAVEREKNNQWYYHADSNEHKIKLLARFIETEEVTRGIVFVRRREDARELSETLRKRGIRSAYLEGEWRKLNVIMRLIS